MKRTHIPGVVNTFEVNDPEEIKSLANDPVIDREFETRTCPINWFLLKRSLSVLSFKGRRFPTMEPRDCATRARAQEELWRMLNEQAESIKAGPIALEPLAEWVRGVGSDAEAGIRTSSCWDAYFGVISRRQRRVGRRHWFLSWLHCSNLLKLGWWFVSGKVRRAKRLLAGMVGDDLSAVNAMESLFTTW